MNAIEQLIRACPVTPDRLRRIADNMDAQRLYSQAIELRKLADWLEGALS